MRMVVLRLLLLLLWAFAGFGICFFAWDLQFKLGPWPFSYWMAAQGALVVFTLILAADAVLSARLGADDEAEDGPGEGR